MGNGQLKNIKQLASHFKIKYYFIILFYTHFNNLTNLKLKTA